jgi:hypothetical protein
MQLPDDAVPSSVRSLLTLFERELSSVRFPDLDGAVLATAAERVKSLAEDVAERERALDEGRQLLAAAQDALVAKAQRALSYAKVFAEDSPELTAKLEAVVLPRGQRKPPRPEDSVVSMQDGPRKRGRPRKIRPDEPLFAGAGRSPELELSESSADGAF